MRLVVCVALAAVGAVGAAGTTASVCKVELLWERVLTGGHNACGGAVPCPIGAADTRASMARAKALGFDVLRFGASGFWPRDQALFNNATTRPQFLAALDSVFDDAKALGVQLVPSLQWNSWVFADLCHESLGADMMREPTSCSHRGVHEFVSTVVARYSGPRSPYHDVVYAWELGNELNLLVDLDHTNETILCSPALGTPARRTAADNFTTADMVTFQQAVAGWVRKAALPQRVLISSGHAVPRSAAHHLARSYHAPQRDWTNDTEAELQAVLQLGHTGLDLMSLHVYPNLDNFRFGKPPGYCELQHKCQLLCIFNIRDDGELPLKNDDFALKMAIHFCNSRYLLSIAAKAASAASTATMKKRVYLGEFGVPLPDRRDAASPIFDFTRDMLAAAAENSVQLATYWSWEDANQRQTYGLFPANATARNDEHTIQLLQAAQQ